MKQPLKYAQSCIDQSQRLHGAVKVLGMSLVLSEVMWYLTQILNIFNPLHSAFYQSQIIHRAS